MEINIPQTRPLSDCEKLLETFPQICNMFHITKVNTTGLGLVGFGFADGSYIGIKRLLERVFNFN